MKLKRRICLHIICIITLLSFDLGQAYAQVLRPARVVHVDGVRPRDCPDRNAGTVRLGTVDGSSNDIQLPRAFLCAEDAFQLIHNRDGDVAESDPDLSTPSGVGYAWYLCPPTVQRTTLSDITADGCILNEPPTADGLYVFLDDLSGDALFRNSNQLDNRTIPDFFNAGDPIEIYFAPITVDAEAGGQAIFENIGGGDAGPCVHVNTDEAFSVVYLTPITVSGIAQRIGANGCQGRFILDGGMPEFRASERYNIQIINDATGATGTLTGTGYGHGDEVRFDFTDPGTYTITVTDSKACPLTFQMQVSCDDAVQFSIDTFSISPGQDQCFDIRVANFDSISVMEWDITWDPNVLEYVSNSGFLIDPVDLSTILDIPDQGILRIFWLANNDDLDGFTEPDGTVLLSICLRAIGECSEQSVINIGGSLIVDRVNPANPTTPISLETIISPGLGEIAGLTNTARADICPDDGSGSGSISLTICGGTPPYTISYSGPSGAGTLPIDPDAVTTTLTGLQAGTYTFDVSDADGNLIQQSFTVPAGTAHQVDLDVTPPSCFNSSNGRITASTSPGGNNYEYTWSSGAFNVTSVAQLANGPYNVTVTDENTGCAVVAATTLFTPEIEIDLEVTPASCPSSADGSAIAIASGGTPTSTGLYDYEWTQVAMEVADTSRVDQLMVGDYFLRVRDSLGCFDTLTFEVTPSYTIQVDNIELDTIECHGDSSSQLDILVSTPGFPGMSGYTFQASLAGQDVSSWFASGSGSVSNLVPLPAGTYTITVTNVTLSLDCTLDIEVIIPEPDPISFEVVSSSPDACNNIADGAITIQGVGGSASGPMDYFYDWEDPGITDFPIQTRLQAGQYNVRIYDGRTIFDACFIDTFIVIEDEDGVMIDSILITPVSCGGGDDGALIVQYTQGNAASYDVTWQDQDGNMYMGDTISNLAPGNYVVTVTAESGCSVSASAVLDPPSDILLDSVQYELSSCPSVADGSITVFVSSEGTLTYSWSSAAGTNSPTLSGVPAGTYSVTIAGQGGCDDLVIDTLMLGSNQGFTADFTGVAGATCPGVCDGQAAITVSGTTGAPNYRWSDGSTTASATSLCGGSQFVVVSDGTCTDSFFIDIPTADSMVIEVTPTPPTCFGDSDGSIAVSISGGTPPYDILWEDNSNANPRTGLSAGNYALTVTDVPGCAQTRELELIDPELLVVSIRPEDVQQITCSGREDGSAILTVMGGSGNISYDWTPAVSSTEEAQNLAAGDYTVEVSDENGCSDMVSFSIEGSEEITYTLSDIAPIACFGETTTFAVTSAAMGAGGPYTYSVNSGSLINVGDSTSLIAGTYFIAVFDGAGCFTSDTITISQPNEILVDIGPDILVPLGDSVRLGINTLTSTYPVDSLTWSSEDPILGCTNCPSPFAFPLGTHTVSLVVVDSLGCQASDELILTVDSRRQVYIPTAFSPNNDGINDVFTPFFGQGIEQIASMQIFNRWGGTVFSRTNISPTDSTTRGWDGRSNAEELTPDVYIYVIDVEFVDGRVITYRGEINLIR